MFSEILDCVSFVHPKEFDQTAGCRVGSSSGQCFKVSGSSADRVLNASVLRGQQTLLFSDLMQSWVQRNNARYAYTSRRGLSEVGFLCAYLPRPILWLTIAQPWKVLSLQCCVGEKNKRRPIQLQKFLCGHDVVLDPLEIDVGDRSKQVQLSHAKFSAAAAMIRGEYFEGMDDESVHDSQSDILAWLDAMSEHVKDGCLQSNLQSRIRTDKRGGYAIEALILACRLANLLRDDARIFEAMAIVARLIGFSDDWLRKGCHLPKQPTISKARFLLDSGFTLMCQCFWDRMLNGPEFWIYLTTDSSPRSGREWLLSLMWIITVTDACEYFDLMRQLIDLRKSVAPCLKTIAEMTKRMSQLILKHVLAPVCVGARHLSVAAKFAACVHSIRLECSSWSVCQQVVARILQVLTDWGTESAFTSLPPFDLTSVFPHWGNNNDSVQDDSNLECFLCADPCISMMGAVCTPGIEHICNNGLSQIGKKLKYFSSWLKQCLACSRFFASPYYRQLILHQLDAVAGSEKLRERIKQCHTEPKEHRFGAIMEFILEWLPMEEELPLMIHFQFKRNQYDDLEQNSRSYVDVQVVADAVQDKGQWAYTTMVSVTGGVLWELQVFSRSCDCHGVSEIDPTDLSTYARRARKAAKGLGISQPCTAHGMRAKDFSCGKAERLITVRFHTFKYQLMIRCQALTKKRRDEVMSDFDSACQLVLYIVGLKITVYVQLPLLLCGAGNCDDELARECCRQAIAQYEATKKAQGLHHELTVKCLTEGVQFRAEMELFVQGADSKTLLHFHSFRCVLACMRANEIPAESLHKVRSGE